MAKGFDRLHVKPAVKSHNKFNLDESHLTTLDFGQIVPLYSKELVPGDRFSVKGNFFSRMAPLVRPTYGKFSFKLMNVFVPFHQVAYDIDAYIDGATTWEGITPKGRYIEMLDLVDLFTYYGYLTSNIVTGGAYDFSIINTSGSVELYRFTRYGKFVYKVLCSLGYALPQNVDLRTSSNWYTKANYRLNALPLLCFAKAYNDYMSQSQRFNTSQLTNFLRNIKYNNQVDIGGITYYDNSNCYVTDRGIDLIFKNIKLCYENDYFTSAWQWPNSALNVNESTPSISVIDSGANGVEDLLINTKDNMYLRTLSPDGTTSLGYTDTSIAQRSLNMLRAFDDWVRRNNYSGSRKVQNIYSRFGIKPDDYKSHYADVISTDMMPIQVGDVTATTAASGQPLGDYAGKGIMNGQKGFTYHASDRGMLFVLGWYTVYPVNAYGFDRSVLRTTSKDFYQPEFDGIGAVDAISYGEVFTDPTNSNANDSSLDNQVFGFTEMFNSYRFGRDKITGDFRNYDNTNPNNDWHTGRLLTDVRAAGEMVAQSSSMNTLPQFDSEYQRIFSVSGEDPFYLTCQFQVSAMRPMLSLNQVPNLGEGDVNVPRNGNEIN